MSDDLGAGARGLIDAAHRAANSAFTVEQARNSGTLTFEVAQMSRVHEAEAIGALREYIAMVCRSLDSD